MQVGIQVHCHQRSWTLFSLPTSILCRFLEFYTVPTHLFYGPQHFTSCYNTWTLLQDFNNIASSTALELEKAALQHWVNYYTMGKQCTFVKINVYVVM